MMQHDPYEILGVAPDSGPVEWKRAYRRLAMRWHPDRNDHPEATERFKAINAAYEQLTAEDQPEASETPAADGDAPAAEPEVAKAADIRLNLELSLEEAAKGCRKTIHYTRGKACATCEGTGEHGMTRTRFCAACHGSGRVRDGQHGLQPCAECGGRGFFTERICADCGGSGRQLSEVSLQITVPPGMLAGDELRLGGQGEAGDALHQAGDLYLTLVLQTHALYALHGRDLHYRMPVSALALLAGGEIELPSLGGLLRQVLDAGPIAQRELRLAGKGYPGRGRAHAGELVVTLEPVFPQQLSARQRKLVLQANAMCFDDLPAHLPEIAAWRQAQGL